MARNTVGLLLEHIVVSGRPVFANACFARDTARVLALLDTMLAEFVAVPLHADDGDVLIVFSDMPIAVPGAVEGMRFLTRSRGLLSGQIPAQEAAGVLLGLAHHISAGACRFSDGWRAVAIGLAPVILEVASAFDQVGVSATAVQEWSVTGAKTLAYGGAAVVEAWKGLVIVFDMLKVGGKAMIGGLMEGVVKLLQLAAKLPSSLGGDTFKVLADDAEGEMNRFWGSFDEDIKAGKQHIADFGDSFGKVDNFFARVQSRADALKKIKIAPQIKIDQRAYDLFERVQKLTVEMRTPLESFAIRMAELNEMVTEGGLGWDIYARAVGKAAGELSKTNAIKMTGAQEFGSQEAYATINNRQMQDIRADPVQRLQDAIAMQTQIQQRQLADMDLIARAVRGGKVVIG